jgi:hypothetical protein
MARLGLSWRCPFCQRDATITDVDRSSETAGFRSNGTAGHLVLQAELITCPNPSCRKQQLKAWLFKRQMNGYAHVTKPEGAKPLRGWSLIPDSSARPFPDMVPAQIREDYEEACRIAELSPKRAATLARRCLQGMVRHVFKVRKRTLGKELEDRTVGLLSAISG